MNDTTATTMSSEKRASASHLALNLLDGLPHPVLLIGGDDTIEYANAAAEDFFQASIALLRRHTLGDLVTFGSPLLALVDHVRRNGSKVNEYGVDLGSLKNGIRRLVHV